MQGQRLSAHRPVLQFTANKVIVVSDLFEYSANERLEVVTVIEQYPVDKCYTG